MAVHKQVDLMVKKAQEVIDEADEQLESAKRQQRGNSRHFTKAQISLEEISDELDGLIRSATPEQRDQLQRAQQRIRQKLNEMILK